MGWGVALAFATFPFVRVPKNSLGSGWTEASKKHAAKMCRKPQNERSIEPSAQTYSLISVPAHEVKFVRLLFYYVFSTPRAMPSTTPSNLRTNPLASLRFSLRLPSTLRTRSPSPRIRLSSRSSVLSLPPRPLSASVPAPSSSGSASIRSCISLTFRIKSSANSCCDARKRPGVSGRRGRLSVRVGEASSGPGW